ncbi:MAG TPA: hypothetical protein VM012_04700 [Flavitalea sp.]|nr:hypothetical protein [Flavitalea sp.]
MSSLQPSPYHFAPAAKKFFILAAALLSIVYLAGAFTPLHLHVDSIRYFNIKDCIEFGCPSGSFAATDSLPYGYTFLLIAFSKLGILNHISIVLINCVFLFCGLYFVWHILKMHVPALLVIILSLFNWTIIKFAIHPLSEMQYIFFSFASLYCFHRYVQQNSYVWLGSAFVLSLFTILTRTIGISLVPALVLGIAWQHRAGLKDLLIKNKIIVIIGIGIFAVLLFFAKQFRILEYASSLKGPFQKGIVHFVMQNLEYHFTELSEIFVNAPSNKVLHYLPSSLGTGIFIGFGMLIFFALVYLMFRKSTLPFYIKAYLFFYLLIIMNWPYYDPRFWVPVIPIVAALALTFPYHNYFTGRIFSRLYIGYYMVTGFIAAAYALSVGLDKETFSTHHATGVYRNEYEQHFFDKPLSDTAKKIDQNVLDILNKYD